MTAIVSTTGKGLTGLFRATTAGALFCVVAAGGAAAADQVSAKQLEDGGALYQKHCRLCHGSKGTAGKRLAGNERVADAAYVATIILKGPGYMTPFADHLSDDEIALITTFVRNSWGNAYGPMASADVAPLR